MDWSRAIERIEGRGYSFDLSLIPWDTDIFGFNVAQVDRISLSDAGEEATAILTLASWLAKNEVQLASSRLPSLCLKESMFLERIGFRFIELVYSPMLSPIPEACATETEIQLTQATDADIQDIEAVAGKAFTTGRFLLDHRLDADSSHKRYRRWVRNAFSDSHQQVYVARIDTAIIGFFIFEDRADGSTYWHLTAMSPKWQGMGLGKRVWAAMTALHRSRGRTGIETTISAHNAPVLNIYARLGFRFGPPSMTFHWLSQDQDGRHC